MSLADSLLKIETTAQAVVDSTPYDSHEETARDLTYAIAALRYATGPGFDAAFWNGMKRAEYEANVEKILRGETTT